MRSTVAVTTSTCPEGLSPSHAGHWEHTQTQESMLQHFIWMPARCLKANLMS